MLDGTPSVRYPAAPLVRFLQDAIGTSTVSKTVTSGTVYFMKLTPDQVNKFEGIVSTHVETSQGITFEQKIYLKIVACGDYIINPIIYTTEVTQETDQVFVNLGKWTHNESGDIILSMYASTTDSYISTVLQITVEGTTNSPTDYEWASGAFTQSNITDSSNYCSSINYTTIFNFI